MLWKWFGFGYCYWVGIITDADCLRYVNWELWKMDCCTQNAVIIVLRPQQLQYNTVYVAIASHRWLCHWMIITPHVITPTTKSNLPPSKAFKVLKMTSSLLWMIMWNYYHLSNQHQTTATPSLHISTGDNQSSCTQKSSLFSIIVQQNCNGTSQARTCN